VLLLFLSGASPETKGVHPRVKELSMPVEAATAPTKITPETAPAAVEDNLVEEDLLVEDVSIDGMCGVY
jgi:mycofactocin precursor